MRTCPSSTCCRTSSPVPRRTRMRCCAGVIPPRARVGRASRPCVQASPERRAGMPREPWSSERPFAQPRPRVLPSTQTALLAMIADAAPHRFTPVADALVVSDARASAHERVQVYAYMYRARIAEALESQFPRLARLLGADAFAALAFAY